eukprot:COSAG05_NODE_3294_length_2172_cov_0.968644_3_plen_252_part_00
MLAPLLQAVCSAVVIYQVNGAKADDADTTLPGLARSSLPPPSAAGTCNLTVYPDVSCTQTAYARAKASDFAACCTQCEADPRCVACEWAGSKKEPRCHLKSVPGETIAQPGTTCGVSKSLPPPPLPPSVANTAWPPIWPYPKSWTNGSKVSTLSAAFEFRLSKSTAQSPTLLLAFERYSAQIFGAARGHVAGNSDISALVVSVDSGSDDPPQEGTDESYQLTVPAAGAATLHAATIYGAIHGLESFSQLTS